MTHKYCKCCKERIYYPPYCRDCGNSILNFVASKNPDVVKEAVEEIRKRNKKWRK